MLYIPPTQNPFLMQSMNMLQNIGMMYLGHNLKRSDEERQRAVQEESRKRDLDTKLVLAGYKPVSEEQQMGDIGNGPPPENQVSIRGLGSYVKPKEDPRVFTAGGATFVADKEGKLTQVKLPGSDKLPSSDMQELADLRKTNPNATMEDVYRMRNQFKQPGVSVKVENTAGVGETAATKKLGEIFFMDGKIWRGMIPGKLKETYNTHLSKIRNNNVDMPDFFEVYSSEKNEEKRKKIREKSCAKRNFETKAPPGLQQLLIEHSSFDKEYVYN